MDQSNQQFWLLFIDVTTNLSVQIILQQESKK